MYSVHRFDPSNFKQVIRNHSVGISDSIAEKRQVKYLCNYLSEQKASTVVIESNYIDSHFLQDYVQYYSSSFFENGRTCCRLHFFSETAHKEYDADKETNLKLSFTEKEFEDLLIKGDSATISIDSLQRSYLGFIMVKPLQDSIIGKTCLETYPDVPAGRVRKFSTTSSVEVNLFGLQLKVRSTLPFQEQDSVVSVCATSALWSYFHFFAHNSNMTAPSSARIIRSISQIADLSNKYSSQRGGLNLQAIVGALEHFGIDPTSYETRNFTTLQELVFAYMDELNQPLLLLLDRYASQEEEAREVEVEDVRGEKDMQVRKLQLKGSHLVVITGYSRKQDARGDEILRQPSEINMYPEILEKLYVHDDQIGPFAKLTVHARDSSRFVFEDAEGHPHDSPGEGRKEDFFAMSAGDRSKAVFFQYEIKDIKSGANLLEDCYFVPSGIITGRPSKVKSSYINVKTGINYLTGVLKEIYKEKDHPGLSWKIRLTLSNSYKNTLRDMKELKDSASRREILFSNLPRYVWVCTFHVEKNPVFEIILDSTDVLTLNSSFMGIMVLDENRMNTIIEEWRSQFKRAMKHKKEQRLKKTPAASRAVRKQFHSNIETLLSEEFQKFLNSSRHDQKSSGLFGQSLPPIYIKQEEQFPDETIVPMEDILIIEPNRKASTNLSAFDKTATYLWLLDSHEVIYMAKEVDELDETTNKMIRLGHPCLNNGGNAKMAGELKWRSDGRSDESVWLFTNASGRYCSHRSKGIIQLEAFILVLKTKEFIGQEKVQAKESDFHGAHRYNSFKQAKEEIDRFLGPGNDDKADDMEKAARALVSGLSDEPMSYLKVCDEIFDHLKSKDSFSLRVASYFCYMLIEGDDRYLEACGKLNASQKYPELESSQGRVIDLCIKISSAVKKDHPDFKVTRQILTKIGRAVRKQPSDVRSDFIQGQADFLASFG